jgi:hypothetical protein
MIPKWQYPPGHGLCWVCGEVTARRSQGGEAFQHEDCDLEFDNGAEWITIRGERRKVEL